MVELTRCKNLVVGWAVLGLRGHVVVGLMGEVYSGGGWVGRWWMNGLSCGK